MKKLIALLLTLTMVVSVLPLAFADEEPPAPDPEAPEYSNAEAATVGLAKIASYTAKISLSCTGKSGTTSISALAYLERWSGSSWQRALINGASTVYASGVNSINTSFTTGVSSGKYRATAVYTVIRNGVSETITVRSTYVTF